MAGKKKGLVTVSGEWAKHLRPAGRRQLWSSERKAVQNHIESEIDNELASCIENKVPELSESSTAPVPSLKIGVRQRRPKS